MKKLKITLILAADKNEPLSLINPFMPLSLAILASLAPEHEYTFIDMLNKKENVNFDSKDDIIGISYRQASEKVALSIADKFIRRGKTVILGGAQPSVTPHKAKNHCSSVVVGEAEDLWPVLINDFQNNCLKDFYVCSPQKFDSKGKKYYQSSSLPELSDLPTPNRSLFKKKYTFDMTFASRGCPVNCDFCLVSDLFGKKIRFKPVEDVIADIKQFKSFYYILDETVFGRSKNYDYYIELYERIAELPKKKYWTGQANIDASSNPKGKEVIKKAAKSGLIYAAVGLESINKETLKSSGAYSKMGIKQKDYLSDMKENIAFIQKQGIIVSGWFAIGYESDSIKTYYDTLKFCEETNIFPVFTPVRALVGSRLWDNVKNDGRLQDPDKHISNIKHTKYTDSEIVKAFQETASLGYGRTINIKRLKFYYKIFRKSEKNLNDAIYKTIFMYITQRRLKKIVINEAKYLSRKVGKNI